MCGIAGWFDLPLPAGEGAATLQRMCNEILHRGPDDNGTYMHARAALGFRRLSIVDLEGGHQPMGTDDGAIHLVFNGEIYNHNALRGELQSEGRVFRTTSDTEVMLRLYERDGLRAFERMNGMFAVAVLDLRRGEFHLVRDRLGVKPLYYARVGSGLVFGSEIKAILASGLVAKNINQRALWDYLTFRYVPAPETIWQGVMKLPPAHSLTLRLDGNGDAAPRRWWSMPMHAPHDARRDDEYVAEFGALFEDAVDLRMRADVPVGITLSGGLDSSAVVAAAHRLGNLKTFSVSFEGSPETDELPYARQVAQQFATDHHEVMIGQKDFMDFLPEFVWHTDEPLADLASIPLHYVCRLARQHVKVVLSGEGSDEILAGYNFERLAQQWDEAAEARNSIPWWGRGKPGNLLSRLHPDLAHLRSQAATICDQRAVAEPLSMTNYWSAADKQRLLRASGTWPDSLDRMRAQLIELGDQPPLNQALHLYCQDWLVEDLLMKADKMSMANSLELRTPFLDYRLVEFAAGLPPHLKAGRGRDGEYRSKQILRQYAKSRLPETIIDRPKQGFPVPVYGWLSGSLSDWARDILLSPDACARDWFDGDALSAVVQDGTRASAGMMERHRLWNLLVLETWMRKWLS